MGIEALSNNVAKPTRRLLDTSLGDASLIASILRAVPYDSVSAALCDTDSNTKRERDLPNWLTTYFTICMPLFPDLGYEELLARFVDSYEQVIATGVELRVPPSGTIARARQRLGVAAMENLARRLCTPVATHSTPGAFFRGLRLQSLDGFCTNIDDTDDNAKAFGRPKNSSENVAYPRCVALF